MEVEKVEEQQAPTVARPKLPNWPTSMPGPRVSEPPPGMKRSPSRSEQTIEVGYDQATATPSTLTPERTEPGLEMEGRVSTEQEQSLRRTKKQRPDLHP